MRNLMIRFLYWLLSFLEITVTHTTYEPEVRPHFSKRALVLMGQFAREVGRSGEWKAHQVYSRLMKEYPSEEHCDLRYEIEALYQLHYKGKK